MRQTLQEGLRRAAEGVASAHGLKAEVTIDAGYPVLVNHADFTDFTVDVARELLGAGGAIELPAPMMGAEDFSYVLQRVPGTFVFFGMRPVGVEHPEDIHSNRMRIDEDSMAQGVAMHAAMALRYLDGTERHFSAPR